MGAKQHGTRVRMSWFAASVVMGSALMSMGGLVASANAQAIPVQCGTNRSVHLTTFPQPVAPIAQSYSSQLTADGGTPPYTFSLRPGDSLPVGLSMSPSGLISGTPLVPGQSRFDIEIMDSLDPAGCGEETDVGILATTGNQTLDGLIPSQAALQRLITDGPGCVQSQLNTLLGGGPPNVGCMGVIPIP